MTQRRVGTGESENVFLPLILIGHLFCCCTPFRSLASLPAHEGRQSLLLGFAGAKWCSIYAWTCAERVPAPCYRSDAHTDVGPAIGLSKRWTTCRPLRASPDRSNASASGAKKHTHSTTWCHSVVCRGRCVRSSTSSRDAADRYMTLRAGCPVSLCIDGTRACSRALTGLNGGQTA